MKQLKKGKLYFGSQLQSFMGLGGHGGAKKLTSWWPRSRERERMPGFHLLPLSFHLGPQSFG
jgi:hypothetical protein